MIEVGKSRNVLSSLVGDQINGESEVVLTFVTLHERAVLVEYKVASVWQGHLRCDGLRVYLDLHSALKLDFHFHADYFDVVGVEMHRLLSWLFISIHPTVCLFNL